MDLQTLEIQSVDVFENNQLSEINLPEKTNQEISKFLSETTNRTLGLKINQIFPIESNLDDGNLRVLFYCEALNRHLYQKEKRLYIEREILIEEIKFSILYLYEEEAKKCVIANIDIRDEKQLQNIEHRIRGDALKLFCNDINKQANGKKDPREIGRYIDNLIKSYNDIIKSSNSVVAFRKHRMSPKRLVTIGNVGSLVEYVLPGLVNVSFNEDKVAEYFYSNMTNSLCNVNLIDNPKWDKIVNELEKIIDNFSLNCDEGHIFPPTEWLDRSSFGQWFKRNTITEKCDDGKIRIFMKNNAIPEGFPYILSGKLYKCQFKYLPRDVATDDNLVVLSDTLFLVNQDPNMLTLSCIYDDHNYFKASTLCLYEEGTTFNFRKCGIARFRRPNNLHREICLGYKESKRLKIRSFLYNTFKGVIDDNNNCDKIWTSAEIIKLQSSFYQRPLTEG